MLCDKCRHGEIIYIEGKEYIICYKYGHIVKQKTQCVWFEPSEDEIDEIEFEEIDFED